MKLPHSHQLIAACMNLNLTSSRMAVLMALCHHFPNVYPGQARIALLAKVCLRTAKSNLKWLAEHGWITARRTNRTNVYTLNVERILRRRQVEFSKGATIALPEVQPLPTNNTREQLDLNSDDDMFTCYYPSREKYYSSFPLDISEGVAAPAAHPERVW